MIVAMIWLINASQPRFLQLCVEQDENRLIRCPLGHFSLWRNIQKFMPTLMKVIESRKLCLEHLCALKVRQCLQTPIGENAKKLPLPGGRKEYIARTLLDCLTSDEVVDQIRREILQLSDYYKTLYI